VGGIDRPLKQIEGEITVGVSLQLRELLAKHDGKSRSVPTRTIDMIEHDANGDETNSSGNGELH
jgi:hypothetical protein